MMVEWLRFEVRPDRVQIYRGERLLAGYIYRGCWRPYFWPLHGPYGNVVRGVNAREHPNQYGVALAYGGHREEGTTSIWSDYDEPPYGPCGKMLHLGFDAIEVLGPSALRLVERTVWVNGQGQAFGHDLRTYELRVRDGGELLLLIRQELPRPADPVSGDVLCAVRVADPLRVQALYAAEGHVPGEIVNSAGARGEEATRDQPARWCDYAGRLGDGETGISLLAHPANPQHPAPFFTRAYGIFTAKQRFAADQEEMTLRWGVYVHRGRCDPARIEAAWAELAAWR